MIYGVPVFRPLPWSNIALVLVGALVFTLSLKGYGGDLYLQDLARHIDQPFLLLALVLALFFVLGFFLSSLNSRHC